MYPHSLWGRSWEWVSRTLRGTPYIPSRTWNPSLCEGARGELSVLRP